MFVRKAIFFLLMTLWFLPTICLAQTAPYISKIDKGFEGKETYTESIIEAIRNDVSLSPSSSALNFNTNVRAKNQYVFLKKQFNQSSYFDSYKLVQAAQFSIEQDDNSSFQFGVVEIGFSHCNELIRAYDKVKAKKNDYFDIKVLTRFVAIRRAHSLVFVYSETPMIPAVKVFMDSFDSYEKWQKSVSDD